ADQHTLSSPDGDWIDPVSKATTYHPDPTRSLATLSVTPVVEVPGIAIVSFHLLDSSGSDIPVKLDVTCYYST
ncbi:hypothetical protein KIPB_009132, partial [Kipferlia bialata]